MLHSPWLLGALFVLSVLPATGIALVFGAVGFRFWVAGVADFLLGSVSLRGARLDMHLLFVTAPLGLVGLWCLWRVFWLIFKGRAIQNPGYLAAGLVAGLLAGVHLLFLKFALLALVLPAAIFALFHLRVTYRRHVPASAT